MLNSMYIAIILLINKYLSLLRIISFENVLIGKRFLNTNNCLQQNFYIFKSFLERIIYVLNEDKTLTITIRVIIIL